MVPDEPVYETYKAFLYWEGTTPLNAFDFIVTVQGIVELLFLIDLNDKVRSRS